MMNEIEKKPFFSIIIPCYNAANYIESTIESIFNQTFRSFEIILVDDCSVDNTYSLCVDIATQNSSNIKLYKNKVNSGPGFSRNVALKNSIGKYICFCDSDDWYESDFLEIIYLEIQEKKADIVFFDFFLSFSAQRKILMDNTSRFNLCKSKEDYIALSPDSLCSLVVKSGLFNFILISESYNAEDSVTIPQLIMEANKFSYISLPLYNYRYRTGSLSKKTDLAVLNNYLSAFSYLRRSMGDKNYAKALEYRSIKVIIYGWVYNAIRGGFEKKMMKDQLNSFESIFPKWYNNSYLNFSSMLKKYWYFCVKYRLFIFLRFYVEMQKLYFNIKCFFC